MKRIVLLFLILCNCLICNAAGISKEVLTANTWKVVYPDFQGRQTYILSFSNDNSLVFKVTYHRSNHTYSVYYKYYLSPQKTEKFDLDSNVDNNSGLYVVVKNKKDKDNSKPSFCWENISTDKNIIEFKDQTGQVWILEKQ